MCTDCDFEDTLDRVNDMLDDERYNFANETLDSIYSWVDKNDHVTEKQIEAVENIRASVEDR